MGWIRIIVVIAVVLQLTHGHPGSHRFRGGHKRTVDRPCEDLATAVGEVVVRIPTLLPPDPTNIVQRTFNELLTSFNIYNQADRERAFCSFEGLETLSDFMDAVEGLELDYSLIRITYNYLDFSGHIGKFFLEQSLADPQPYQNVQELRNSLTLIQDLEAFGMLDLDPTGHALVQEISELYAALLVPGFVYTDDHEPLSTLPTQAQCRKLTNDIRKVWNDQIKQALTYNPNASQDARAAIKQWTGVELTDHQTIKAMVCDFVEAAHSSEGLFSVSNLIRDMEILQHTLKSAYPYLKENFDDILSALGFMVSMFQNGPGPGPSYPYPNGGNGGVKRGLSNNKEVSNEIEVSNEVEYPGAEYPEQYGPSPQLVEVYEQLLIILTKVQEMGLINLEDDLFTETRRQIFPDEPEFEPYI